jgi:uncharacterized protein (TIGR00369 family)
MSNEQNLQWDELEARAQSSFWGYLGCELVHADEKEVILRLDAKAHHLNMIGIVHGGVLSSLLDNAMGIAASAYKQDPNIVTGSLNVNFLRPMKSGILEVRAHVVHATKRVLTLQGTVVNEQGELGTMATGTFHVRGQRAGG